MVTFTRINLPVLLVLLLCNLVYCQDIRFLKDKVNTKDLDEYKSILKKITPENKKSALELISFELRNFDRSKILISLNYIEDNAKFCDEAVVKNLFHITTLNKFYEPEHFDSLYSYRDDSSLKKNSSTALKCLKVAISINVQFYENLVYVLKDKNLDAFKKCVLLSSAYLVEYSNFEGPAKLSSLLIDETANYYLKYFVIELMYDFSINHDKKFIKYLFLSFDDCDEQIAIKAVFMVYLTCKKEIYRDMFEKLYFETKDQNVKSLARVHIISAEYAGSKRFIKCLYGELLKSRDTSEQESILHAMAHTSPLSMNGLFDIAIALYQSKVILLSKCSVMESYLKRFGKPLAKPRLDP